MEIIPWVILIFAIEGQAGTIVSTFTRKPAFDNLLPKKGQLWSVSRRSWWECGVNCQTDSKCISYFYESSQCTGFPFLMTSYVATDCVLGTVYTELKGVDALFVALLRGGWRDKTWLFASVHADRRNTLIVEMAIHSSLGIHELQRRNDYGDVGSLSGMAAIFVCLRDNNVQPRATIITLSDVQQRQAVINFLGGSTALGLLSDHDLASMCD